MRESENWEEVLLYEDFNQDVIVGSFLLGLRENFNTTSEAICFVSEKVNEIICLEIKIRISMIKESLFYFYYLFILFTLYLPLRVYKNSRFKSTIKLYSSTNN